MSLVDNVRSLVSQSCRNKGDQYFWQQRVSIVSESKDAVTAIVRGSSDYTVQLTLEEDALFVSCTCPFYGDRLAPCKHVWATIRKADANGSLADARNRRRLRVLTDENEPSEWDEGEGDFFDEDADDDNETGEYRPSQPFRAPIPSPRRARRPRAAPAPPQPPVWKRQFAMIRDAMRRDDSGGAKQWPVGRELVYLIDLAETMGGSGLILELAQRDRKKNGDWSKLKSQSIDHRQIRTLPDAADREILAILRGAHAEYSTWSGSYYSDYGSLQKRFNLANAMRDTLVPLMCRTGRCWLRTSAHVDELRLMQWDDALPWEFCLEVRQDGGNGSFKLEGSLRRGDERLPLSEPLMLVEGGLVFFADHVARLNDSGAFAWISFLRKNSVLTVRTEREDELLEELLNQPHLPRLDLPDTLRFEEVSIVPRPRLMIRAKDKTYTTYRSQSNERLRGELAFDYDGVVVPANGDGRGIYQPDRRRRILRDPAAERAAHERLQQVGFREMRDWQTDKLALELTPRHLPRVVRTLIEAGWHVEAEGKLYRTPGNFKIEVTSGVDWFELHGDVQFGESTASLPALLAALKRGENVVALGDGTFGMLPEEWLKKYGVLAGLGTTQDDHLRFTHSQVGLLDALLAAQPEASCDAVFTRLRDELRAFDGVKPAAPPESFVGELRDYQKIGLGWFDFLDKFRFGGCLADDMGLGKTVQVLALLESRRTNRDAAQPAANGDSPGKRPKKKRTAEPPVATKPAPSLVVVPKSLVFNWKQEAARFTPNLRLLDHTGTERVKGTEHFDDYDLVVTTYGTLRRDAVLFKDVRFDYVILDEAQMIKNANTESAKAARLLTGDHRLALSGTPVENHLGELWSLFEFLNPGMLGAASVLRLGGSGARNPDADTRSLLARALRPFILRRTKDQVAKELPPKLEQTLYCELEETQRKLYDELRDHYRRSLLKRVSSEGMNKSKIQILEALLRLRQAAIHPGLIDRSRTAEPSAKLDLLLPQLEEVLDEGHKAIVFSQFTSMLAILRDRLDQQKIPYEYLDGKTRDRGTRVERFQTDPACKLFLVSLKAGGLGLNLTAAEYVFLLDPWWNPAVEAQAIDRTHRIGQTRQVFAYRLIARDTVEEKILELQNSKRSLADAIINADNGLIRNLSREDLELLLS